MSRTHFRENLYSIVAWCQGGPCSKQVQHLNFLIFLIKTLLTLGLERKIYRNEMITGKDKKVTQASHSRASGL